MDELTPPEAPETQPPSASAAGPSPTPPPSAGLLRRLYREEREAWRRDYRKYFKIAARALGLSFVAGYLYFSVWPVQEARALHFVVQSLKDIDLKAAPLVLALTLFYHNALASALATATGVIPYAFLPIFDTLLNGGVQGLLVSIAKHQHLPVLRLIVTQVLPHGVIELTGVLYATSVGLYLSAEMGRRVREARRKRRGLAPDVPQRSPENFLETYPERVEAARAMNPARNVVRSFVLVVLPLLFVAAMIEGLITPHLR